MLYRSRLPAWAAVVLFLCLGALALSAPSSSAASGKSSYIILIDAGSSGSRVHVHEHYNEPGSLVPTILPSKSIKIKPGLSSYASDPSIAGHSLLELLQFAQKHVPRDQWKQTPVHLQATAGLRSIPTSAAEAILEHCRDVIATFPFQFKRSWARIISGTQEGLNGWLATNYLMGVFHDTSKGVMDTKGVIEMGGASLQLTFAPHSLEEIPEGHPLVLDVPIAGRKFKVYTYSYLNYGLEAAQKLFHQTWDDLIDQEGNPCFPRGYRHSSTGSYQKCLKLIEGIIDKTLQCTHPNCAFNGVYQPRITRESFFAIENFFYTTKFFNIHEQPDALVQLKNKGLEFCSQEWAELTRVHADEPPSALSKYCFASVYLPKILEHGFGFQLDAKSLSSSPSTVEFDLGGHHSLRVVRDVQGTPIDWALGAVLYALTNGHDSTVHGVLTHEGHRPEDDAKDLLVSPPTQYATTTKTSRPSIKPSSANRPAASSSNSFPFIPFLLFSLLVALGLLHHWNSTTRGKAMAVQLGNGRWVGKAVV